jgi:hypothetical protein
MNPHDIPTLRVAMRWRGHDIVREIQIDPYVARCFEPLPRDHDFPGMPFARRDAEEQRRERRRLASSIASALTDAIMEEVNSQDPRNGYTPEENLHHERKP